MKGQRLKKASIGCCFLLCLAIEASAFGEEDIFSEIPNEGGQIALASGEIHYKDITIHSDDFLHLVVVQHGVDVAIRLRKPTGEIVSEVDSPNGKEGPEELLVILTASGRYRVEVIALGSGAGNYSFAVAAQRPATQEDRLLVEAHKVYREGLSQVGQGAFRDAVESFHRALPVFREQSLVYHEAAGLLEICLARWELRELPLALADCDRAAELFRATNDRRQTAIAFDWAGLILLRLGETSRAVSYFEEALPLFEQAGHVHGAALCASRLAAAYGSLGNVRRALDAVMRARQVGLPPGRQLAVLLSNLGEVLLALYQYEEARGTYGEAIALFREIGGHRRELATALRGHADAAALTGDLTAAKESVNEALGIYRALENPRSHALALRTVARIRRLEGDRAGALEAIGEAVPLSQEAQATAIEGYLRLERGYLQAKGEEAEAGLAELERAKELLTLVDEKLGLAAVQARSAEALMELGRLQEAWERIAPALDTVETSRAGADRRDYRSGYFETRQSYFEIAMDILMRLHQREPQAGHHLTALAVHERRLVRELRDTLALHGPGVQQPDSELRERERDLQRQLSTLALGPSTDRPTEQIDGVLGKLYQLWADMRARDGSIPVHQPVAGPEEIRRNLDEGSLVLVYALREKHSLLWTISQRGVEVHEVPPLAELKELTERFARQLAQPRELTPKARHRLARKLREALLDPVVDLIAARRLILVPDGVLQAIPFASLPEPGGDDDAYLVRQHEIVVLPSLSTLVLIRQAEAERPPRNAIAAFADPVFSAKDPRLRKSPQVAQQGESTSETSHSLTRSGERLGFDPFKRLHNSRSEAESILAVAPPAEHLLAVGLAANRESLLALPAQRYRILHFATHGIADPEYPELSGLVLSMVDGQGQAQRGYLPAYEVARLHLPVELVVLSACETGVGKVQRGEGVLGLSRAFLDAGAARVLASLWRVNDRYTAQLMTAFYDAYLKQGKTPAAALRAAQLKMLGNPETTAPYAWAAFVLQGDWRLPGNN